MLRIEYQNRPIKVPINPGIFYARTNNKFKNSNKIAPTTTKPKSTQPYGTINSILIDSSKLKQKPFETLRSGGYDVLDKDALLSLVDTLLENKNENEPENKTQTIKPSETTKSDDFTTETTTMEVFTVTTLNLLDAKVYETTTFETTEGTTMDETTTNDYTTTTAITNLTIEKTNNVSDCFNRTGENRSNSTNESGNKAQISTSVLEDVTIVDLESKVKVSIATLPTVPKIPPEIEAILNRTKQKDPDYEYDYNEPSLPPSLPNLRLVTFLYTSRFSIEISCRKRWF